MRRILLLSALIALSGGTALAQQATPAQQPSVTTASYGNWVLRCVRLADAKTGEGKSCEIVQTIQMQNQQQPLAQIAIGRLPGEKPLVFTAVLPTNIAIPGAVHLSGNGKADAEEKGGFDLTWRRCLPGGCFADARPDAKALAALDPETPGQIRFADAAARLIAIPVSWQGLQQALKALQAE